jgi:maltose O-acetyltransferase
MVSEPRNSVPIKKHIPRLRVAWRSIKADLRRWPFDLMVNVFLASPLVPRVVRGLGLRAVGMSVESYDIYPRCAFRSRSLSVGKGTVINHGCHFDNNARVDIGSGVSIAAGVTFVTTGHRLGPSDHRAGELDLKAIRVGDGCWIGADATILPGVSIGDGCIIGAGSVVRADCEPNGLYMGVPARRVDGGRDRRSGASSRAAEADQTARSVTDAA